MFTFKKDCKAVPSFLEVYVKAEGRDKETEKVEWLSRFSYICFSLCLQELSRVITFC